ncbi:hypothetical protein M513_00698 [Trichuris suis]|uniref:Uncharacterized protein n=1 Tax=Trichuris suis TaxID=68888 RepID=A0A085MMM6_9BILA|nr:hypothetical protein M513_00698 [Trichuris suis]
MSERPSKRLAQAGGDILCYEEREKDRIASITPFVKRAVSTEANDQSQSSTSKHAGISYPPALTALRSCTNK